MWRTISTFSCDIVRRVSPLAAARCQSWKRERADDGLLADGGRHFAAFGRDRALHAGLVVGHLHACGHEPLHLDRALEDLVDLRAAAWLRGSPLPERV